VERDARLSVRVPQGVKTGLRDCVQELKRHGVSTTETELVEMFVAEGTLATPTQLDARLRDWRKSA
jgi:hypothetical protein